jgi:hypothetical protein
MINFTFLIVGMIAISQLAIGNRQSATPRYLLHVPFEPFDDFSFPLQAIDAKVRPR